MTGKELNAFLDYAGLEEQELADLLGVTNGAVRHWLNDRRAMPNWAIKVIGIWKTQPHLIVLWEN